VGITWLALPFFNNIAGKSITMGFLLSPAILLLLITLPLWVGLGNQVEASAVYWWFFQFATVWRWLKVLYLRRHDYS
jgi:hypothetical protein